MCSGPLVQDLRRKIHAVSTPVAELGLAADALLPAPNRRAALPGGAPPTRTRATGALRQRISAHRGWCGPRWQPAGPGGYGPGHGPGPGGCPGGARCGRPVVVAVPAGAALSRASGGDRAVVGESPRKRPGERAACALLRCGACRDDDLLQPADRVKMIACPDHADGGGARFAVIAEQVVTHGFDEAAVGSLVVGERFG